MRVESDRLCIANIKECDNEPKQKTLMTVNGEEENENRQRRKVMATMKTRVKDIPSFIYQFLPPPSFLQYSSIRQTYKTLLVYSDQQSGVRWCEV